MKVSRRSNGDRELEKLRSITRFIFLAAGAPGIDDKLCSDRAAVVISNSGYNLGANRGDPPIFRLFNSPDSPTGTAPP